MGLSVPVENMPTPAGASSQRGAAASWAGLMHQVGVGVPLELRRTIQSARRLRRLRVGKV